jgi:hypothetical protein
MKSRALLIAIVLVQCKGETAPAPSPAPPAPAAADSGAPSGTEAAPGPAVGAALPAFEAPDQEGRRQGFDTLRGPNGLLLNFNRSVVW